MSDTVPVSNATIPIKAIAPADVEEAVRQTLRDGLRPDALADFLATVDWSNVERAPQGIRETLGALEACATEYAERDITEAEYRARLLALVPAARPLAPAVSD